MTGAEDAGGDPALHGGRQPEQSDGVGDLGPGPLDPGGQLVLGAPEVGQQLLVRRRLFQRVELGPVQVLQQRVAQQVVVLGLPHDGRNHRQAGGLGGPPAPLAHHQLEPAVAQRADDHRLQQADLVDRVDQLGHGVLVEHRARLPRVGRDGLESAARRSRSPRGSGPSVPAVSGAGPWPSTSSAVPSTVIDRVDRGGDLVQIGPLEQLAQAAAEPAALGAGGHQAAPSRAAAGDLLGGLQVRHGTRRVGVVGQHRLPVARRLGDPDRPGDHRGQRLRREVRPHLLGHLRRQPRPTVVHGQQDRSQPQPVVQLALDQVDGPHQL